MKFFKTIYKLKLKQISVLKYYWFELVTDFILVD